MFHRVKKFFIQDIWDVSVGGLKGTKGLFYRFLRIIYLSGKGFWKDQCTLRASALTFYTLMSTVPFLALSFAVAKAFGYQVLLERELFQRFSEQKQVLTQLIEITHNLLQRTEGGILTMIGVIVFFWSVIKVLNHMESSMNAIWNVDQPRKFKRKCTDYLAAVIIIPIFFLTASSTTIYIVSHLRKVIENINLYSQVSESLIFMIKLFPYCIMWFLFSFLYIFMPNTKVRILPAIIGGVVAGTVYQLFQWGYLNFQIGVSKYNTIYGSFAAVPLFLVWLQVSWITVLVGAEISYSCQNSLGFEFGKKIEDLSHQGKILIALWIVHQAVHRFISAKPPIAKQEVHEKLQISYEVIDSIVDQLAQAGFMNQIDAKKNEKRLLQIARPPENIRIGDVVQAIEMQGDGIEIDSEVFKEIQKSLMSFYELIKNSPENKRLIEIFKNSHE